MPAYFFVNPLIRTIPSQWLDMQYITAQVGLGIKLTIQL